MTETRGWNCLADPAKGFITHTEYDRLASLLAAAPTSEGEDQALLDSGIFAGAHALDLFAGPFLCGLTV